MIPEGIELQEGEVWKEIPGFPLNGVSNHGRVCRKSYRHFDNDGNIRARKPILLEQESRSDTVAQRVELKARKNGKVTKSRRVAVHMLVAEQFLDNPKGLQFVLHKDGDPANNCADNLQWCTKRELLDHKKKEKEDDYTQRHNDVRNHSDHGRNVCRTEQPGGTARKGRRPYGRSWSALYTCGWS